AALRGHNVCYVDYDFGSPTAGAVFTIDGLGRGVEVGGVHTYLQRGAPDPMLGNVWDKSERRSIRGRPERSGELMLMPGDAGGSEFVTDADTITRCRDLFLRLEQRFDISFVDLSAGRSYAAEMVLRVLALPEFEAVSYRWLIFHRWTRQHILAAANLLDGDRGLVALGVDQRLDEANLRAAMRFVRTAVVDPMSEELSGLKA